MHHKYKKLLFLPFIHSFFFLKAQGNIYTIGSNKYGKLGINNKNILQSSYPCRVDELLSIKCIKVSCGINHSIAITENGEVY